MKKLNIRVSLLFYILLVISMILCSPVEAVILCEHGCKAVISPSVENPNLRSYACPGDLDNEGMLIEVEAGKDLWVHFYPLTIHGSRVRYISIRYKYWVGTSDVERVSTYIGGQQIHDEIDLPIPSGSYVNHVIDLGQYYNCSFQPLSIRVYLVATDEFRPGVFYLSSVCAEFK